MTPRPVSASLVIEDLVCWVQWSVGGGELTKKSGQCVSYTIHNLLELHVAKFYTVPPKDHAPYNGCA